jgi:hypothetical protein
MKLRTLTDAGKSQFRAWLDSRGSGDLVPEGLLDGLGSALAAVDADVDLDKTFSTRHEFGKYIVELLGDNNVHKLLAQENDGVWDWLSVAYFPQFGKKVSKSWHYTVTRRGHSGSLAYRHLARTSVEMYWRHRDSSLVMLNTDLSTWGDMSEQLTSRQNVAYHRSCITTANALYLENGKLRRGAAGRVPPKARRKPGDRRGRGGVGRLALAVRRLCRTYDTHVLESAQMISLLPKEFSTFAAHIGVAAVA